MAGETDAKALQKVLQKLNQFSETVSAMSLKFSKLFSEVFHIPLNDDGSVLEVKMSESLYKDDFASHLGHLKEMCSILIETADASRQFKSFGSSLFKGEMALKEMDLIYSNDMNGTLEQISKLKELASKFKELKEDQKKAFEGYGKAGNEETILEALKSKLKAFIVEEARKVLFESELETDPEILLTALEDIESSIKDVREVTRRYKEVLKTVVDRMKEVKGKEDAVVAYISGVKDTAKEIVQACETFKTDT